jgi:uncharacterized membrane protein YjgN (DUF898 family)
MSGFTLQAAAQPAQSTPVRISWAGNPWSLFGLCFLNFLLFVITVGIYWFWSRTEYRRYMWQMVRINGEPLEYTGKGKELLIGYLKLFAFIVLPLVATVFVIRLYFSPQSTAAVIVAPALYIGWSFLYFVGVFRAHRYVLSRTQWRGIALGLTGNAAGYGWKSFWTWLLTVFTLGWIIPWRTAALRRRLTAAMSFGSVQFRFEGRAGPLYGPFTVLWLCFIGFFGAFGALSASVTRARMLHPGQKVLLGWEEVTHHTAFWVMLAVIAIALISRCWYEARKLNLFARATRIGSPGTDLRASGESVLWLTVSNLFILILSLGLLRPIAQARRLRYLVTRMAFLGPADLDEVLRGPEREGSQGAGLEASFAIEIF